MHTHVRSWWGAHLRGDSICQRQRYEVFLFSRTSNKSRWAKHSGPMKNYLLGLDVTKEGTIKTDLTFLKDQKLIRPIRPGKSRDGNTRGKPYYLITYELIIIVEARNLRYQSRYPCGSKGTVFQRGQVCIASAFQAGTGWSFAMSSRKYTSWV